MTYRPKQRVLAVAERAWGSVKRPIPAAVLTGVEVLGTAIVLGVGETAIALAAGYVVYRTITERPNAPSRTRPG
jgi:hypothetical protein